MIPGLLVRRALSSLLLLAFVAPACGSDDESGDGDPEAFCASFAELGSNDLLSSFEPSDPNALATVLDEARALQEQAPPEVDVEVEVVVDSLEEVSEAFEQADGVPADVLELTDNLESIRDAQAAVERITVFVQEECDLPDLSS